MRHPTARFAYRQAVWRSSRTASPAFAEWNQLSTLGYMVMAAGMVIFFINMIWSLAAGKKAPDNYWGEGATTLEWTLSSPPPYHQFETLPRID